MAPTDGREREIKLELASAEDRDRLLASLPSPTEVKEQHNHYYDLPGRELRSAGVMLRLRLEATDPVDGGPVRERARLTVKEGAKRDGAGLFDSAETESEVPLEGARNVARGSQPFTALGGSIIASLRERFGDLAALERWGILENRRSVHRVDAGFVLEVDRAVYPDGTVLNEVELESDEPERARAWLLEYLRGIAVDARPSTASKSERLANCGS